MVGPALLSAHIGKTEGLSLPLNRCGLRCRLRLHFGRRHSMIRAIAAIAAVVFMLTTLSFSATGAELLPPNRRVVRLPSCPPVWRCGPNGCRWYHVCLRGCPDALSCYPLYGAYGPYGGVAYWGAYSDDVWGPSPLTYSEGLK
jgi:hypothetical protein